MRGHLARLLLAGLLAPALVHAASVQHLAGRTMGTTWTVSLEAAPERAASLRDGVQARLDEVVAQMSTWEPESALSRYNRATAGSWHRLPAGASQVVAASLELARDSGGAFDPTIGPLVDAWGYGPARRPATGPDMEQVASARSRIGWERLQLAPDGRLLQPGDIQLDLSAIATGHGVDRVAGYLLSEGITDFLVEVGGELRAHGRRPDGLPWRVAVEQPAADDSRLDDVQLVVRLDGMAIATSGDYRRSDLVDGHTVSHILDPRTGQPVTHSLAAVTVLHPQAMQADALATTLLVLGPVEGLEWARERGIAALLVWREGQGFGSAMTDAFAPHVVQP